MNFLFSTNPGAPFIRAADEWVIERSSTAVAFALAFLVVILSEAKDLLLARTTTNFEEATHAH